VAVAGGVRWVVFDFGEVLSRRTEALASIAAGLAVEPDDFERRYWAARRAYDAGQPDAEYWTTVAGRALDAETVAGLVEADSLGWLRLDPGSAALLRDLHAAGVPLALLSNAPSSFRPYVEAQSWSDCFRVRVFSGDLGVVKPDPRIYAAVTERLGAPPAQVTFFDDRSENVAGARTAGWTAHRWQGAERARITLGALLDGARP
jgi:putative hydrolase of the HAD superfamily